ncbi:hypothetical protein [Micromonospora sp. DT231]|uniref:hypothetical protein n=1 Tax=Micromonospora sp. DT231 TaxID=3416526 RepID=UPI003CED8AB2
MSRDVAWVLLVMLSVVALVLVGLLVLESVQAMRGEVGWSGVVIFLSVMIPVGLSIALLVPRLRR